MILCLLIMNLIQSDFEMLLEKYNKIYLLMYHNKKRAKLKKIDTCLLYRLHWLQLMKIYQKLLIVNKKKLCKYVQKNLIPFLLDFCIR